MTLTAASPFDALASEYDSSFTRSAIGRVMREAVWQRLDANFKSGDHILELNCGTGEDAVYLARRGVRVLATDIAAEMCKIAQHKALRCGLSKHVTIAQGRIEDLTHRQSIIGNRKFDGVLSNFGGLNCVESLITVARDLATVLRSGGRAVLCIMGPHVPWEWMWHLGKAQPRKAFRRLQRGGTPWHGLHIRYPSVGETRRAFEPHFRFVRASALGALVPPSYAEAWARKHPRMLQWLNRAERRYETNALLVNLADHYVIEFERNTK